MFSFIQSIFAYFGFEKSPLLTIEDKYTDPFKEEQNIENANIPNNNDNLDDDTWITEKRKIWKRNNISSIIIKDDFMISEQPV